MTDQMPELINSREVYRLTGNRRTTIWRLRREGKFPLPVRQGGSRSSRLFWYRSEIEDYLNSLPRHDIQG